MKLLVASSSCVLRQSHTPTNLPHCCKLPLSRGVASGAKVALFDVSGEDDGGALDVPFPDGKMTIRILLLVVCFGVYVAIIASQNNATRESAVVTSVSTRHGTGIEKYSHCSSQRARVYLGV